MRTLFPIVLALAAAAGCAPRAKLLVLRPAELDIAGIGRLAVVDFAGDGDTGRLAHTAVLSHLAQNRHFDLIDQAELSRVQPAAFAAEHADETAVVQAAREAGVDGVLTGQVVSYDAGAAQARQSTDNPSQWFAPSSLLAKPPTVTLAIRLIDARTGETRAVRQITRTFHGRDLPARDAALNDLMNRCADEAATLISPHYEPVEVELARQFWGKGLTAVRLGNAQASAGQWDEAAATWQTALADNPRNHAALHNLALASFAREDYTAAMQQIDKAIAIYADAGYHRTRRTLAAERQRVEAAQAQTRSRPVVVPPATEIASPPNLLPSTGAVIPAALQAPAAAAN